MCSKCGGERARGGWYLAEGGKPLCLSCHVYTVTQRERALALVDFINDTLDGALDPVPGEDDREDGR